MVWRALFIFSLFSPFRILMAVGKKYVLQTRRMWISPVIRPQPLFTWRFPHHPNLSHCSNPFPKDTVWMTRPSVCILSIYFPIHTLVRVPLCHECVCLSFSSARLRGGFGLYLAFFSLSSRSRPCSYPPSSASPFQAKSFLFPIQNYPFNLFIQTFFLLRGFLRIPFKGDKNHANKKAIKRGWEADFYLRIAATLSHPWNWPPISQDIHDEDMSERARKFCELAAFFQKRRFLHEERMLILANSAWIVRRNEWRIREIAGNRRNRKTIGWNQFSSVRIWIVNGNILKGDYSIQY